MSSDWLSHIDDGMQINALAIPGTHDSSAWTHWEDFEGTPGTWAQRKSITEQLDLGVRVLDLRVGWARGYLLSSFIGMFHGPIYLNLTLKDVLAEINTWLEKNDEEFVILIFQQQGKWPQADCAKEVRDLVNDTFGDLWHKVNANWQRWPRVGELRGKVMCLGRLKSDVADFCNVRSWLTDGDNTDGTVISAGNYLKIYLQDRYKGLSSSTGFQSFEDDCKKKFAKVRAAASAVPNPHIKATKLLRINHMSFSNLRFQPWETGERVNTMLRRSGLRIKGVLMIDDADQDTVDYILSHRDNS